MTSTTELQDLVSHTAVKVSKVTSNPAKNDINPRVTRELVSFLQDLMSFCRIWCHFDGNNFLITEVDSGAKKQSDIKSCADW